MLPSPRLETKFKYPYRTNSSGRQDHKGNSLWKGDMEIERKGGTGRTKAMRLREIVVRGKGIALTVQHCPG
jgi:hypothetical protein